VDLAGRRRARCRARPRSLRSAAPPAHSSSPERRDAIRPGLRCSKLWRHLGQIVIGSSTLRVCLAEAQGAGQEHHSWGDPPVTGSIVSETVLIMLSMANVVAIISVLSTAVVAITIPFINARLERRRLAWQSKQAQVDELRRFLDDATLRIQEATVVLWEILDVPFPQGPPRTMERLATMERSTFSEDELSRIGALADRYERKFQEITQDKTRLDLRLGPDDSVTRAHAEVTRQLLAFRPRTSAFSDLAKGATTVTVSWSLEQLEILAHLRETLAGEVRAFFGWVRPA
jgi:hypothetical protein